MYHHEIFNVSIILYTFYTNIFSISAQHINCKILLKLKARKHYEAIMKFLEDWALANGTAAKIGKVGLSHRNARQSVFFLLFNCKR
jgi:hypothetical protein